MQLQQCKRRQYRCRPSLSQRCESSQNKCRSWNWFRKANVIQIPGHGKELLPKASEQKKNPGTANPIQKILTIKKRNANPIHSKKENAYKPKPEQGTISRTPKESQTKAKLSHLSGSKCNLKEQNKLQAFRKPSAISDKTKSGRQVKSKSWKRRNGTAILFRTERSQNWNRESKLLFLHQMQSKENPRTTWRIETQTKFETKTDQADVFGSKRHPNKCSPSKCSGSESNQRQMQMLQMLEEAEVSDSRRKSCKCNWKPKQSKQMQPFS